MKIRKMQTAAGGPFKLTSEELKYLEWSKMTPELKREYRANRAKTYLLSVPNITNFWEAFQTYIGNRDPKNPHLQTGDVPTPGLGKISTVGNIVAKEYLINSGQNVIKSTDYLIKGIQGAFPKVNLSTILKNHKLEILDNGILSEFKNTGRFKNLMNEILSEIEKVYGKSGLDAFNIIKVNPEGLPYRIGQEWSQKYDSLFKQGGKMNILEFLKNGSGIHIKEKNKGKFTKYCHGKVTDECILKGKNSSNPAIRKRATFAANSRKWKHEKGGLLKFEEGGKNGAPSTKFLSKLWFKKAGNTINNIGNNIGDFLKTDTGKGIMDIGLNILSGYTNYKKASNLLDSQVEQSKASLELAYLDTILLAILNRAIQQLLIKELWKEAYLNGETLDNYSDIVASHIGYDLYSNSLQNAELQKKQLQSLLDLQARNIKGNMMGNLFGSVVLSELGVLGNVLGGGGSSSTTKTTTTTPKTTTTNYFTSPLNDSTKFWSIK